MTLHSKPVAEWKPTFLLVLENEGHDPRSTGYR